MTTAPTASDSEQTVNAVGIRSSDWLESLRGTFYKDEYVAIYHGNSAEIIPTLGGFDLLLTDLVLGPGSSGIDLARTLRSRRPDLAVIVLSAYDASQVDLSGLGENIEFWSKPADIDRLATRLDKLRRNRQVR